MQLEVQTEQVGQMLRPTVQGLTWANIDAGDTVYISGGADSTLYVKDNITSGIAYGGQIVVTKGWEAGHNGTVIFAQSGVPAGWKTTFYLYLCSNIKLTNLTFTTTVTDDYYGESVLYIQQCDNIVIDRDTIYNSATGSNDGGNATCLTIQGASAHQSSHISITNNYIEAFTSNNPSATDYGRDVIWIGNNYGGHTITGNTLIQHSGYAGSHPDLIQMYNEGSANDYLMTIADNIMIYDNDTSSAGQGIYLEAMLQNRYLFYNNIIVMNTSMNQMIKFNNSNGTYPQSIYLFNNTLLATNTAGDWNQGLWVNYADTLVVKNNFIMSYDSTRILMELGYNSLSDLGYIDIDYNQYLARNFIAGVNGTFEGSVYGTHRTWDEWQAAGYDANSDTGSVSFPRYLG